MVALPGGSDYPPPPPSSPRKRLSPSRSSSASCHFRFLSLGLGGTMVLHFRFAFSASVFFFRVHFFSASRTPLFRRPSSEAGRVPTWFVQSEWTSLVLSLPRPPESFFHKQVLISSSPHLFGTNLCRRHPPPPVARPHGRNGSRLSWLGPHSPFQANALHRPHFVLFPFVFLPFGCISC